MARSRAASKEATKAIVSGKFSPYVEMARTKKGRLFKKQILKKGRFAYSGKFVDVTEDMLDTMVKNFNDEVCDIVQIPLCGDDNSHTEAPDRNIGEVIGLQKENDALYAVLDVREQEHADKVGSTYLGASAYLAFDYTDTRDGKPKGPTLLHVAVTNRPHLVGLEPFEELIAASAETVGETVLLEEEPVADKKDSVVELSSFTKEQLLEELKSKGVDVTKLESDLQAKEKEAEDAKALSAQIVADIEKSLGVKLSSKEEGGAPDVAALSGVIKGLADDNAKMSGRVEGLEAAALSAEMDGYIREGRLLPAQKEAAIKLAKTDRESFAAFLPKEPVVKLEQESGVGSVELSKDDETYMDELLKRNEDILSK